MAREGSDFRVRRTEIGDWVWIHQILQNPEVIDYTSHPVPPSEGYVKERWETRIADPTVCTLVAEIGGKVVGYIRLKRGQGKGSHVGEISTMAVSPDWQKKGVGTELIKEVINLADNSLQLRRLRLTVHSDNLVAINLYQKFGFEVEGRERKATYKSGNFVDILVMGRVRD